MSNAIVKQRDITWDCVKGLAMILVVVGHSGCPSGIHRFIYLFHMGLFFYISGLFIKKGSSISDFKTFAWKKVKGLYKPYVVWAVFFILIHNVCVQWGWTVEENYSFITILKHCVNAATFRHLEPMLVPFWFLRSLFFASIISWFVICVKRKWIQIVIVMLFYGLACLYDWLGSPIQHLPMMFNRDAGIVLAVWLGYSMKDFHYLLNVWQTSGVLMLLIIGSLFFDVFITDGIFGPVLVFPVATVLGVLLTYNVAKWLSQYKHLKQFLSFVGQHTIEILALHLLSFHVLSTLFVRMGIGHSKELVFAETLKYVALPIPVAWLLYSVVGIVLPLSFVMIKSKIIQLAHR